MTHERPASVTDVAELLCEANERHARVMPTGGGTHLCYGTPFDADIVLHTGALRGIVQYVPEDMTISVEAGVKAGDLSSVLAQHGCRLPLDVEEPDKATVGGMSAIGFAGPRRFGLGTLRDHLIGARVVLASGVVVKTGGMVVKNVSGYDLTKLLHGSMGSLGVIVELNFKLLPMPAVQTITTLALDDGFQALRAAANLLATRLPYSALQAGSDGTLLVGCEGNAADVRRLQATAREIASALGGSEIDITEGDAQTGEARASSSWCRWIHSPPGETIVTFRVAATPSRVAGIARQAETLGRSLSLEPCWHADAGCGIVDVSVNAAGNENRLADLERALIAAFGSVRVTRCAEHALRSLAIFGRPPDGLALMQALKSQFDPNGVLNAGANVGGI